MDDEFGDLYSDVEVQASSAIDALCVEPEDNSPINGCQSPEVDEKCIPDSVMEDSDSEDDLNIVLNDDDCEKFPVTSGRSHGGGGYEEDEDGDLGGEGTGSDKTSGKMEPVGDGSELNSSGTGAKTLLNSHFKYVRPHGSSFPSKKRVNGRTGVREEDAYNQKQVGSLVANRHATTRSLSDHFGYGFSLPWYRTILDVNIDAFEEKPWRHPGTDITDFFNFSFNEDSWKRYCNSLEKLRQQSSRQAKIPSYYSKFNQAYEAEAWHERATQEATTEDVAKGESSLNCADKGEMLLELPKGRAIQVEDSINERQPSMDHRRPRSPGSDVIIQIIVQDSTADSSDSGKEELGHGSKSVVSKSGKMDAEDDRDVHVSVSASSDELSGEHYPRLRNDSTSSFQRSLQPTTASDQNSLETNNHGKDNLSDKNGGCHPNMDVCILEGTAEATETKVKEKEVACRNTHQSDPCMSETEPSHDNQSHFSPTFSFSESDFEDGSEDSVLSVSFETRSPLGSQSLGYGTELQKSVDHKSSRSDDRKTKSDDGKDFSMHTSPMRHKQKLESWRHRHSVKQMVLLERSDDTYPISDAEGDWKKYRRRRNPVEEEWKHHRGRRNVITDWKIYPENCYEASPLSNVHELCDKDYSSFHCGRRKERPQDLGYHDREGFSHYRKKGPCVNDNKRYVGSHLQAVNTKAHLSFKDDSDQFLRRNWNRKEFYNERQADIDKEDNMDGFWYHEQELPAQQRLVPHTYRESGRLVSRYSSASTERDIQWRRRNDRLQLRKKTDLDYCPLDYKHEDEWLKQKFGTSISFTHSGRGVVEPYERFIPPIRREFKVSGRKGRYVNAANFHLDRSWQMDSEDDYQRHRYNRSLALAADREPSTSNGRRWCNTVSSRNEGYDSKLIERYHRHQRIVHHEEDRDDDWFGSYNYTDDNDFQNDNDSWRRGRSKRSRLLHWREDKFLVNDRLFSQGASFSFEETSKHDLVHAWPEPLQDEMLNDFMLEHHGYEITREGSDAAYLKGNSIVRYRSEHKQKVRKDRDSVHLLVGKGKSSGRHLDGRSLTHNTKHEKMGLEYPMEWKSLRELNDSSGSKAVNTDNPNMGGRRNNEKQLGKFSLTQSNRDLDIEEGQIICGEQTVEDINLETENASETIMQRGKAKSKTLLVDNASAEKGGVVEYDNKRILETLAKMEKRRERFKDPITIKQEMLKTSDSQVELLAESVERKQQRPTRKRQWGVR